MIRLFREPLSNSARLLKRTSDIAIAAVALILAAPLWLLIALLIKLDSPGPVFYLQERVGMDGRMFLCYKFRTMHPGADSKVHREYQRQFIAGSAEANLGDGDQPVYKFRSDARITRVGRWLRRASLDEVPQLFNVLRGDMSVVGPRPPIPGEHLCARRKSLSGHSHGTAPDGTMSCSGTSSYFRSRTCVGVIAIEQWSIPSGSKISVCT